MLLRLKFLFFPYCMLMRALWVCFVIGCLSFVSFADDRLTPAISAKVERYITLMVQRCDQDRDGILQQAEWQVLPGSPQAIDLDGNQQITHTELMWYVVQYGRHRTIHRTAPINLSEPYKFDPANLKILKPVLPRPVAPLRVDENKEQASELSVENITSNEQPIDDDIYKKMLEERQIPAERPFYVLPEHLRGAPAWFILNDKNGDGQISLSEFAPTLLPAMLNLFKQFDKNSNGLIEPDEVRKP